MQLTTGEYSIRIALDLPVPSEAAWILLSSPDALAIWWGDHVTLDVREGGHFREEWQNDGQSVVTNGTVLRSERPIALEMTWADNNWSGQTRVRITLEDIAAGENPGGCRLTLEHCDWQHVHTDDPAALIAAHAQGWQRHLQKLAALASTVAGGNAAPPQ